jgi:hypothetical protein
MRIDDLCITQTILLFCISSSNISLNDRQTILFGMEKHSLGMQYILLSTNEKSEYYAYEPGWLSRYRDKLRAGRPRGRSSSPGRVKNFLFSTSSRPALGPTQTPIQCVPRVKRPRREADHSPATSAEIKKMWIYTSLPYTFSRCSA